MLAYESAMPPPPGEFDPDSALGKFLEITRRRPMQQRRRSYRPRKNKKQTETLMDILSDKEEDETDGNESDDNDEGEAIDTTFDCALD